MHWRLIRYDLAHQPQDGIDFVGSTYAKLQSRFDESLTRYIELRLLSSEHWA